MRFPISFILLCISLAACNDDKIVEICLPKSLRTFNGDSIVYQYNDARQLTAVYSFYSKNDMKEQTDLVYNNGNLVTVTHTFLTDPPYIDHIYSIEYGEDNLPSKLTDVIPNSDGKYITEFTHDEKKRLVKAVTNVDIPSWQGPAVVNGYSYEYNEDDNVTRVKFLVNDPGTGGLTEVVARENMTFDSHRVFHADSKDLAILNVYVSRCIPNTNNVLTSRITWRSFTVSFMSPVDITFVPVYDDAGKLKQYTTIDVFSAPAFGDLTFTRGTYDCR